jgi:Zn-dependent protease with chaperone function
VNYESFKPHLVATAQVVLSCLFLGGYFAMLALFLLGHIKTPPEWKDQLGILIGVLTAGVMMILQFWFSRSRPQNAGTE